MADQSDVAKAMLARQYSAAYPVLGNAIMDPRKLMELVTTYSQLAASRQPGSDYDSNGGSIVRAGKEALKNVYGMDFIPPGFQGAELGQAPGFLPNPRQAR